MVSFELDEEQKMIQEQALNFANNEIRTIARDCDEKNEVPDALMKKAWDLGFLRTVLPEKFGGYGSKHSVITSAIMAEELAFGDISIASHILSPALFAIPVMLYGTEAQKEKYLPLYCKDQYIYGSLAVMEPSVTFDTNSIMTTAMLEGGEWVLNGSKCYVPLASKAEHILVLATLNKGLGEKGLGAFIVDKGTYGMEISEKEKNMGFKPLHTNEITFADCKIPRENRLGGDAGINISQLISCSRVGLAAMAVGVARASLQYALQYAKDRVAFGEPIASRQAIAFMLADMAIEVDATRYLVWEAAWRLERGDDGYKEAFMAKRYAANQSMLVTDYGIQVLGGHGYIREHPVEMWFRNARGIATLEGMVVL